MSTSKYLVPRGSDKNYGVVPGPVESPLDRLTDEQKNTLSELRNIAEQWGLTEEDRAFADDLCLYRYDIDRDDVVMLLTLITRLE